MAEGKKKWIIKNAEGLVSGPFSTEKILSLIRRGDLSGEEWISTYPGNQWKIISKDPQFYDHLLEALSNYKDESFDVDTIDPSQDTAKRNYAESGEVFSRDDFQFEEPDEEFVASKTRSLEDTNAGYEDEEGLRLEDVSAARTEGQQRTPRPKRAKKKKSVLEDIELVDIKEKLKKEFSKRARLPLFILAGVIFVGLILLSGNDKSMEGSVRLLSPREGGSPIPLEQAKVKYQKAQVFYFQDTLQSYLSAQNELISLIEGQPKEPQPVAMLCMTYFELWPYATQDSSDFSSISKMVQLSSKLDPAGIYSSTCRVLDLYVRGRFIEAKNLVESVLEAEAGRGRAPVNFYYLKAMLLAQAKEYLTAIGYLQSAEKLEPLRLRAFVFEAQLQMRKGDMPTAARILRQVLDVNSKHHVAKVLLGIIEARYFGHFDLATNYLKSGLGEETAPREIASDGYFALAEIYLEKNNTKEALEYAQKAYSTNSSNEAAKNLIVQLGGVDKLKSTKFKDQQLIFEGDQFVREGDCNAAQAHYKAAYELDKSAVAAMKAGQCLWKLSFSTEAIEWLQTAIKADPKLIGAYVLLADYYTQRYNFMGAMRTLNSAQKINSKSYEVYRGFALVELRRNSVKGAITYGKKALALYETDVETHIILAEAYLALKEHRQAYAHAAKAVEIDANNRKAQIVYGQALAGIQGADTGIAHLVNLVRTYPLVTEYRLALGKLYAVDERYSEAEEVFRQVIQIEEKPKEAYLELGKVLRKTSKYEEALNSLLQAAVLDPADAEPLFESGQLYLDLRKPNDAMVQFQRVLKINKRYPLVHYWMGKAALARNNPKDALKQSREEQQLNPNLADAYLLAAEAYTQLGQYNLCAREYQKAIRLRPQGAHIYVNLAKCYRLSGSLDVAESMLNHAATQESGFADIYREQGEIYERKGDWERAIEAYSQYFVLSPNAPDRQQIENRIRNMGRR